MVGMVEGGLCRVLAAGEAARPAGRVRDGGVPLSQPLRKNSVAVGRPTGGRQTAAAVSACGAGVSWRTQILTSSMAMIISPDGKSMSSSWLPWAATLAAVILAYYYYLKKEKLGHRRQWRRRPPGPRALPLIGNLLDLRGNHLPRTLARLSREHGPVMSVRLGLVPAVVVSSPGAAREAITKHDRRLAARPIPDAARALGFSDLSIIWLPSTAPLWATLRGIASAHLFSPRSLAGLRGVRERKVGELVAYFRGRAGREVDVGHAVYGGVFNLVSSVFFSVDVVTIGAPSAEGLQQMVDDVVAVVAAPNVSDVFPLLRSLDLQGLRRWAAVSTTKVYRILDAIIDRRLAEATATHHDIDGAARPPKHNNPKDFLAALLEHLSTGKITRTSVTTILFDLFVGATDAITITVVWTMAELLRNPGVMARLREEIDGSLGGRAAIVEEPDAASLPYLRAVVMEAMRLHPVTPVMMLHMAVEDGVEIGGYTVPKGCMVIFNSWAIMRDPAAWERPDEFLPERFLQEDTPTNKEFEFVPFGSGRRRCPGMPMAELVVPFIVLSLIHSFHWQLPNGMSAEQVDVREKFTTVNVMAAPLKAVPILRTAT